MICCLWTFSFQIVAAAQYLFSAELPSAVLRSESNRSIQVYEEALIHTNTDMNNSQDRSDYILDELDFGYCHLVSSNIPPGSPYLIVPKTEFDEIVTRHPRCYSH